MHKSLIKDYSQLKLKFINSNSKTRNKSIELPRCQLEVGKRVYSYTALKTFNNLPNNLKSLDINKRSSKNHLKSWILKNILY